MTAEWHYRAGWHERNPDRVALAARLAPFKPYFARGAALAMARHGDAARAHAAAVRALRFDPHAAEMRGVRMQAALALGDAADASTSFARLCALAPTAPAVRRIAAGAPCATVRFLRRAEGAQ